MTLKIGNYFVWQLQHVNKKDTIINIMVSEASW